MVCNELKNILEGRRGLPGHVGNKWKSLSCVRLFATPWTIFHGTLQSRILEWVAFPFPRGSSQSRDWTQNSGIAGGFFTNWATRETHTHRDSTVFALLQTSFNDHQHKTHPINYSHAVHYCQIPWHFKFSCYSIFHFKNDILQIQVCLVKLYVTSSVHWQWEQTHSS